MKDQLDRAHDWARRALKAEAENAKLRAGLEDIRDHSHPPFEGFKWMSYINEVARETLAACDTAQNPLGKQDCLTEKKP